jgi:hypothetical protein
MQKGQLKRILIVTKCLFFSAFMDEVCSYTTKISGKNKFAYFPYTNHLFEILEPNLMKHILSELTSTSFNSK